LPSPSSQKQIRRVIDPANRRSLRPLRGRTACFAFSAGNAAATSRWHHQQRQRRQPRHPRHVHQQRTWLTVPISAAAWPMAATLAGADTVGTALTSDSPAPTIAPSTIERIPSSLSHPRCKLSGSPPGRNFDSL